MGILSCYNLLKSRLGAFVGMPYEISKLGIKH